MKTVSEALDQRQPGDEKIKYLISAISRKYVMEDFKFLADENCILNKLSSIIASNEHNERVR